MVSLLMLGSQNNLFECMLWLIGTYCRATFFFGELALFIWGRGSLIAVKPNKPNLAKNCIWMGYGPFLLTRENIAKLVDKTFSIGFHRRWFCGHENCFFFGAK